MIYGIIFIIILFLIFIGLFIAINNNKFQFNIIKIEEAENDINILLEKKKELLLRAVPIIEKELKIDNFLPDLHNLEETNLNNFEIYNLLKDAKYDLYKTLDENEKLYKSESLNSILEELLDNEDDIGGTIKFYNDNVIIFNKLVVSFPSKLYAFLFGYKKKEFYNNKKREVQDILTNK